MSMLEVKISKTISFAVAFMLIIIVVSFMSACNNPATEKNQARLKTYESFAPAMISSPPANPSPTPIAPETKIPETNKYIGSIKSTKYHSPSCEWAKKISTSNETWFRSAEDARSKGYVPCKVCNPP